MDALGCPDDDINLRSSTDWLKKIQNLIDLKIDGNQWNWHAFLYFDVHI